MTSSSQTELVMRFNRRMCDLYENARQAAPFLSVRNLPTLGPEDGLPTAQTLLASANVSQAFAELVTATAYADSEADYHKAAAQIPVPFERIERALEKQGSGPYFNGARYSLVDAAYAPFLQRYMFLERIKPNGIMEKFPRLKAWTEALMNRPGYYQQAAEIQIAEEGEALA